jgi:predicted nucleotidyltransferase
MSRQIRIGAVLVIAALLCAALASLLLAEGGVGPFRIITHEPPVHALGVPLNANVRAMFYDDVNAATVTSATFVLHGNLGGLASGTLSYNAGTRVLTLDPNRAFHTGEVLRVSATSGISSTGGAALPPYGWQFTAGPAVDRRFVGFTDIGAGLTGVNEGSVAWGDYDNDGDLDILLTGNDSRFKRVSKVYRNDGGGAFADIGAGLTAVYRGSVAWGDYDNDRDLDILLTGHDSDFDEVSVVYRNDEGAFADIGAALAAVGFSSVAWGDYDNDGDLDILLTGFFPLMSKVYRNDGVAGFTDIGAGLTAVLYSSVAWGDYDNDGDLDVVLTGMSDTGPVSRVYRNAGGGTFNAIGAGLTGVYYGSVAWGDYDNDGDLDILLTGYDNPAATEVSKVYRNDGGAFTDIGAGLTGVHASSVAWGDYDNDGDLDILLTGWTGSARVSKVYRNESAPELGTVTPSSGSGPAGVTRYFNTTWRDPDGWQDLKRCYFHIGASPSPAGNVTLMYDVQDNKLWMRSDDGTTWLGGYAPWSNNTIEHRQAKVYCALTRDEGSGDTLSVRWAIKFKADFRGVKKTGLKCTDLYGVRAKGAWMGTWNIY